MKNGIGILIGILVNFIWGLAFLIPHLFHSIDPLLLTAGRYIVYGILSIGLLLVGSRDLLGRLNTNDWKWALAFAFTGNVGYYAILVFAIRFGSVPIAAVVIGTLPVTLAIYGNIKEKEFSVSKLLPSIGLIVAGLLVINGVGVFRAIDELKGAEALFGSGLSVIGLVLWTWYGVNNARYLKRVQTETPGRIGDSDWSVVIGIATFAMTIVALVISLSVGALPIESLSTTLETTKTAFSFIGSAILLGVVVSWLATLLWNKASRNLPVTIAGQLVVFETISSIVYVSVFDWTIPSGAEIGAIAAIICGISLAIRQTHVMRIEVNENSTTTTLDDYAAEEPALESSIDAEPETKSTNHDIVEPMVNVSNVHKTVVETTVLKAVVEGEKVKNYA